MGTKRVEARHTWKLSAIFIASVSVMFGLLPSGQSRAGVSSVLASFPGSNGPLLLNRSILLHPDGSEERLEWNAFEGRFSADGARIAYVRRTLNQTTYPIEVRETDGSFSTIATFQDWVEEISWSPDGEQLAVQTAASGRVSIYRVPLDRSAPVLLVTGTTVDQIEGADWDPTGSRIAYVRGNDIFTVSTSTGMSVNHTGQCTYPENDWADCSGVDPLYDYSDLNWAPDGSRLVADVTESRGGAQRYFVGVYTLGSQAPTKVADISDEPGSLTSPEPVWSPDGTTVAFNGDRTTDQEPFTYIVSASGGTPTKLGRGGVQDWQPCSPSGCPSFSTPTGPGISARGVTLTLQRHIIARGAVTSQSPECMRDPVSVQRLTRSYGWVTFYEVEPLSDGSFRQRLSDRPGRYRAIVLGTDRCAYAESVILRHAH